MRIEREEVVGIRLCREYEGGCPVRTMVNRRPPCPCESVPRPVLGQEVARNARAGLGESVGSEGMEIHELSQEAEAAGFRNRIVFAASDGRSVRV